MMNAPNEVNFNLFDSKYQERFHKKYAMPDGIFGCWVWTDYIDKKGYGRVKGLTVRGKTRKSYAAH